ncbi:unnamed protein product [Parascedosporium putredinis]|uniref:Uncharacterized protein n=1 Tax=Parascedosporium putredinis TaxID=1442378 RepID=A0A9P1HC65_9PEZI|nr:unnamed protein product [Parascedosporium putredinis]CAI8002980.1 unnamed protein product [Parascedosporium putredinis]
MSGAYVTRHGMSKVRFQWTPSGINVYVLQGTFSGPKVNMTNNRVAGILALQQGNNEEILASAFSGGVGHPIGAEMVLGPDWNQKVQHLAKIMGLQMGSPFDGPAGRTVPGQWHCSHSEKKLAAFAAATLLSLIGQLPAEFDSITLDHLAAVREHKWAHGERPNLQIHITRSLASCAEEEVLDLTFDTDRTPDIPSRFRSALADAMNCTEPEVEVSMAPEILSSARWAEEVTPQIQAPDTSIDKPYWVAYEEKLKRENKSWSAPRSKEPSLAPNFSSPEPEENGSSGAGDATGYDTDVSIEVIGKSQFYSRPLANQTSPEWSSSSGNDDDLDELHPDTPIASIESEELDTWVETHNTDHHDDSDLSSDWANLPTPDAGAGPVSDDARKHIAEYQYTGPILRRPSLYPKPRSSPILSTPSCVRRLNQRASTPYPQGSRKRGHSLFREDSDGSTDIATPPSKHPRTNDYSVRELASVPDDETEGFADENRSPIESYYWSLDD